MVQVRNQLLNAMSEADLDAVRPHFTRVDLVRGSVLELPGRPFAYAHFLEDGFVSVVIDVGDVAAEIGLVGREGVLGVPAVLGSHASPYRARVRHDGSALRIAVDQLRRLSAERTAIGSIIMRFVQAEVVQLAHTSFANARLTLLQRLARWLLMAHDRIDGDALFLTHDVLADALDVRRPGVTTSLHELEGERAIRSKRNTLTVLDRDKLMAVAGPAYGPAEAAYAGLVGVAVSAGKKNATAAKPSLHPA